VIEVDSKEKIVLRELINCSLDDQVAVREIRNQKTVRSSMYTDHEIGLNEHLNWISNLKSDSRQVVFVVFGGDSNPVGVVSLNAIDSLHEKADWAYYLDEESRGGLGAVLEFNFLNFVFRDLDLKKLNCEVIESNAAVVKLHKKFLFQEEGFRRSNIIKNDNRIGVHFLGITKDEWLNGSSDVYEKYRSVFDKYEVIIDREEAKVDDTLSLIEKTRSKNNVNWMALLRICVEKDPDVSKPIIQEILRLDRSISDLTAKLVKE
jgi:UDP-4-amino-4,6-dideoxy-N-acetyl-beta-L-altrosamine N-acetyltransferase